MILSLYCDGSSSGRKDGPTGWGWVLVSGGKVVDWDYGGAPNGTNNTAELSGAINGLVAITKKVDILKKIHNKIITLELVCDSMYVLNMASGEYAPTCNFDLVGQVKALKEFTVASTRWVRGHSGDPFNTKVDKLAKLGKSLFEEIKEFENGVRTGTEE